MEIIVFLLGLGCMVLVTWAIALLGNIVFGRKRRRRMRSHEQSPKNVEVLERETSTSNLPVQIVAPREIVAPRQPLVSTRLRLPNTRHQQYIRLAAQVLKQLRSTEVQLPKAIAILRQMNPYAFEELLLTCCQNQGWDIERNFSYSNDGGLDGRVTIAGKRYLIQAKRYRGYINPQHIRKFRQVIQGEEAAGGFFIHTGKTGDMSKELLREYRISLLSGQKLVNFVLARRLKVVG